MSQKTFDNNLVAIRKSKVSLKLSKPVYVGICVLNLNKVFYFDNYSEQLFFEAMKTLF